MTAVERHSTTPLDRAEPDTSVRVRRPGLVRAVMTDRRAWIAVPVLAVLVAMAIWPTWLDGAGPRPCDLRDGLMRPSLAHPFGRDLQGCELFARTVHGTRNSMLVGAGAVGLAGVVAVVLGSLTAMSRAADAVVRMVVDLFLGIPVVLVGLTVLTATETRGPLLVVAVLSFFGWPLLTRVMRAEVLRVASREYVDAARAMGARGCSCPTPRGGSCWPRLALRSAARRTWCCQARSWWWRPGRWCCWPRPSVMRARRPDPPCPL